MAEAPGLEALYQDYKDDGFIVITLLGENMAGNAPSEQDLEDWADSFGLHHPVVADPGYQVTTRYVDGGSIGLPAFHLIDTGGEIMIRDGSVSESHIQQVLP